MRRIIGVTAVIGLAVSLTWAAEQLGGWLGFTRQDTADVAEGRNPGEGATPGSGGVSSSQATAAEAQTQGEDESPGETVLSAEVTSIEEDLARIEEALGSDEVLEEFTPSEPLSADNPVVWPTDI